MDNISQYIIFHLKSAYDNAYGETKSIQTIPDKIWKLTNKTNYDYSFVGSIAISKIIKNPSFENVQKAIIENLKLDGKFIISVYGRDINFKMTDEFLNKKLFELIGMPMLIKQTTTPEKVLVDFSSPNVAKDLHVGHLRSTIIGDTICRIFEARGHNVSRINHIGDFGTQFGMLVQHLFESKPDFEKNPPDIKSLQKFYEGAKERFIEDEEFKKLSHEKTVLLQQNDPDVVKAWKLICDISKISYNSIYSQLNITLDECGESFYRKMLPDVVTELEEAGLVSDSNGAKVIHVTNFKFPLIIVKSDGGYTYDTTDLAAIKYRLQTLQMNRVYYVVDSGQATHFALVFTVAEQCGWLNPSEHIVEHIGFGLVLGEDRKRIRSRDGGTIPLTELLERSLEGAKKSVMDRIIENNVDYMGPKEIQEAIPAIAYGAIKYADLSGVRTNDYIFSFERMLELKGNTVVYQLYSHVRLSGILRNLQELSKLYMPETFTNFTFHDESERKVSVKILQLPEVISDIEHKIYPHKLCVYMYELSDALQKFCTKCRCINYDKDNNPINVNMSRAMLCKLTHRIQQEIFSLLNIQTIERI